MNSLRTSPPAPLWPWVLLLAGLVLLYFFGLDSAYAPTNGDELVYVHIARATAQTGQWLPMASELEQMRNTKPPLLFWQAMVAGDWGQNWSMAALRLPSVV
jgi:4-amino-4-deoxy-L-arabinose transferase-like glycosyltransferase